jgi:hypothetical protein
MAITLEKDGLFWKVKDGNKTVYKSKDEKKAKEKYNRFSELEIRRETLREKASDRWF